MWAMLGADFARDLTRDFSRRAFVTSRLGRTQAMRLAYLAYAATLSRSWAHSTPEAIASLRARLEDLFTQDWKDAEDGYYPRELITSLPWREYASVAPRLLADLPRTRQRIREKRHDELDASVRERYPHYYARNFHYQTDGYLGHTSAQLYDLQVELLFGGTADVMRRRLIPPVVRFAREQGGGNRPLRLLDVGCGTGHFLSMLGAALPGLQLCGVDLSPHYIARARAVLPRELDVSLLVENAEHLPFLPGHFDAATSVFIFHELPGEVRADVIAEMARVVRPGGLLVLADSVQDCDSPELKGELRNFPARFHEPYYLSYVKDDLARRARDAGLEVVEERAAFVTKVVVARKPLAASAAA
jgi:ubiquinone/menaquinone biosynthesis C-methylase UbiE